VLERHVDARRQSQKAIDAADVDDQRGLGDLDVRHSARR
jgi:hypothetical protein